ncbi:MULTISPECIES: glycerol transporter subunit C [unclassified Mycoplasma]|uniref:glycerol transporter subunit C n=1 Tax=unclassified Mycoplasma TaxID=2683645 RepID=UPI00211CD074|nr:MULTISPECIES: glycerol transporter subunit C [unclassified Mycoplasma]UUM19901.1 glycerol transporter subunit C [Mycoplasma sp. 1578d]UUM24881.1 glycerol transporter subunit C [Mycoplasma sp. 3686d]
MYKKIIKDILIIAFVLLVIMIILFPLYMLILLAFMSNSAVTNKNYFLYFKEFEFRNFSFFGDKLFWNAILISLESSLALIIIRLVTYSLFVIGLSKLRKKITKTVWIIVLFFSFIPEFTIYFSLDKLLNDLHLANSLTPLSLVTNSIFSYFFMYNLSIHFEKSKKKYHKVALVDNLTVWQKMYLIYWKEMKEIYLLLIVFSFVSVWNDFLWPNYLLSGTQTNTVGIWFRQIGASPAGGYFQNIQSAGALIVVALPLIVYFIFSKKIVKSI